MFTQAAGLTTGKSMFSLCVVDANMMWGGKRQPFVVMTTSNHAMSWESLGKTVKERRTDLGLTQSQASRKAGLSLNGWGRVELGHRVRFSTLEGVEKALRWRPGTAVSILRGDSNATEYGDQDRDVGGVEFDTCRDLLKTLHEGMERTGSGEIRVGEYEYLAKAIEEIRERMRREHRSDDDELVISVTIPLPRDVGRMLSNSDRERVSRSAVEAGQKVAEIIANARRNVIDISANRL